MHTFFSNPDNQLKITKLDILMKQNMLSHHTEEYETEEMVLRRGSPFELEVILDRDFVKGEDEISVEFLMGNDHR